MMEQQLDMAVSTMIEAVKDSQIYKTYRQELEEVSKDPELKKQIDEFRTKNFMMQSRGDTPMEEMERFEYEHSKFREDPRVSRFLAAELAFCRMMQRIYLRITEAVDFD